MDNPLKGINGQLMVMAAHGYCLGRQTYIVGAAIDWLWQHREHFEDQVKSIIVRDTVIALMDGHAGADPDAKDWKDFAIKMYKEMSPEQQDTLRQSLAYKRKPWPLDSDNCDDCGRIYYNCVCSHEDDENDC
jgi:hypothetical protein